MIASARLSSTPLTKPLSHPGQGSATAPITKPIEKRLINAPSSVACLSGNQYRGGSRGSGGQRAIRQTTDGFKHESRHGAEAYQNARKMRGAANTNQGPSSSCRRSKKTADPSRGSGREVKIKTW